MRLFFWALLATSLPWMIMASGIEPAFFSYRYTIDDLPNGLRLITVPTDMPRIVALYTVVQAGSRDEVEPGKSGFAHLFEHMMFRGSKNFTPEQRDAILKRAGASANAYTSDDLTVYHEVFSADDLEQVMKLEADRFQRLQYGRDAFKTETRAVLGEYNKSSADPQTKMYELLRATAFTTHTYRHTTMGFLADIENMPNEYDYSLQFYQRYYRPEYTTIVLVGDLTRERALSLTEKFFGDWKRGDYAPHIPVEPPQTEPRSAHIDWPTPTLPQLYVAFHGPAYSDEKIGKAALDLLAPIAFGENSDLYRRLVFKEQKVDRLEVEFDNLADPELFSVYARVKSPGDLQEVQDQILATFKRFSNETIPQAVLDATRSRLRYGTALALNSSEAIASFLAPYVALRRSPATIDKLFALYDQVSPSDVRDVAARYFVESNRVIVTLASKVATPKSIAAVLQPGQSPLVSFRILFQTGSAADPPGQEGVAALTAALLAQGGTRTLPYDQIVDAMYPMATTFNWQVDKEMTVFYGTTHRDNLERYYELIRSMLLEPGFRSDDFARLKAEAINFLKITLRNSNDEELAKEQLYNLLYAGTPYGHHNRGRISSLEKITLDDVRAFYRSHYNQANLVLGLAGGYPDGFPQRVAADFVRLPEGEPDQFQFAMPKPWNGLRIEIIQRQTRSTAISLGFPIAVTRRDADWPALEVVTSYFGQHRSSNSHLYQCLRETRGLNYGDYAYIEYFPSGMFQFEPDPNLGRHYQTFQIWIRPVEPQNGLFALRAALYEYNKLWQNGLSPAAFDSTREFLGKYANLLTQTQSARLGYALDSRYYGIGDFPEFLRTRMSGLTVDEVNQAIRRDFSPGQMQAVIVTQEAAALRQAILEQKPSSITYNAPKPKEILDEDRLIEHYPLEVKPEAVTIVPADQIFE